MSHPSLAPYSASYHSPCDMGHYGHHFGGHQVIVNLLTLALIGATALAFAIVGIIVAVNVADAYKPEEY